MSDLLAPTPDARALQGVVLLTIPSAARRLRASTAAIVELIASGSLGGIMRGGRLLVPETSLRMLRSELQLRESCTLDAAA